MLAVPSNAIGTFTIGVSPIGTISLLNPMDTVISQYANSPILLQLINNFFQYIDQSQNLDSFYDLIWNVDTAVGYGLDVWGRIVGVTRTLQVTSGSYFGYEEAGTIGITPFNAAPFYAGGGITSNFNLSDDAFRTLIFAKALANISDGSIPSINQLLLNVFGASGKCYVTDGENMTMTYTFTFPLTALQQAIVFQSGVLPKPTGVTAVVVVI